MAVKIDLQTAKDTLPYFIYKRIPIAHFREYFTFRIDYGFGYLLRSVRVKYPELSPAFSNILASSVPGSGVTAGTMQLEFFDQANFKARQPLPFPARLISTPGSDKSLQYAAPSPVDADGLNVNLSAAPEIKSVSNLNFLYKYGDVIRIDITGQVYSGGKWSPYFMDLQLCGYYVPQKSLAMYGGKE